MEFKWGFCYNDVQYGWKAKKLYRLPFNRNNRTFGLKEIKPILIGSTLCYNIQRNKLTIQKLKSRTEQVDWSVETFEDTDCPF